MPRGSKGCTTAVTSRRLEKRNGEMESILGSLRERVQGTATADGVWRTYHSELGETLKIKYKRRSLPPLTWIKNMPPLHKSVDFNFSNRHSLTRSAILDEPYSYFINMKGIEYRCILVQQRGLDDNNHLSPFWFCFKATYLDPICILQTQKISCCECTVIIVASNFEN